MKYFWMFLLICGVCSTASAGEVLYDGTVITFNDKYSGKGNPYHNLDFTKETDLKPGTIIYASVFYQEWVEGDTEVEKHIFPNTMTGVTFYNCNLDNVYIPLGNTVIGGLHRKIKIQNDLDDWELNNDLTPKEPLNKEKRLEAGVSIDPKDIPNEKFNEEERNAFEKSLNPITP